MNPKISIITVSYNAVKTIEQTILSVLNQTYKNIEYIIIDGGSKDGTVDIIKKYEKRIAYWKSEPDSGIYDAMNKGILQSTGDFIQILGADDCLVSRDSINTIANYLNETIEILSANVYPVNEKYKLQRLPNRDTLNPSGLTQLSMIPHQGAFVNSKIMKKHMFNTKYSLAADCDFILKCILEGVKIFYVQETVAFFSTNGTSYKNMIDAKEEVFCILNQYPESKMYAKRFYKKSVFPKCLINTRKKISRKIREFLLLEKRSLFSRGWQEHKCNNEKCRWCNSDH